MELRDYLRALRNHWVGALLLMIIVGGAAFGYSLAQTKVYAANATGWVGTGQADNPALGSVNDAVALSKAVSYVEIAKSRATAERVIADLDLDASPSALVEKIEVTQPVDTVYIKVTAEAGSPQQAQRLADSWVHAMAAEVMEIEAPSGELVAGTPRVIPIESAELPSSPVSPNIPRNVALGLLVGALLGLAYAVLRSTLDRRLRNAADVEARFTTPVIASIPAAPVLRHEAGERANLALDGSTTKDGQAAAAEAFRKLRTNLMFMRVDNPPRILVVTSPKPSDGKSTVAANIAAAIASSGQSVVIVDADLRRPTVAASFGVEASVGVTNVLAGQIPLRDALQQSAEEASLRVLAAGPLPPNPSELVGTKAMEGLLHDLAADNFVVVDAPPLLPVTDAAVLATVADGAFVVMSAGKTLDTELGEALDSLAAVNATALGVIVNKLPLKGNAGYYGYYGAYASRKGTDAPKRKRGKAEKVSA